MKIKTSILKDTLSKLNKCASNDKFTPLTNLLGIEIKNNTLRLIATDNNNQLETNFIIAEDIEDFYTVVNIESFVKLVNKTTSEYIELNNTENYLEFKGNGKNKLDIFINEDGEIIKFKNISLSGKIYDINLKELQSVIKTSKFCLHDSIPLLSGYYISDFVLTTNAKMVCHIQKNIIDSPMLIYPETAEILLLLDGDHIKLTRNNNHLLFETENYKLYASEINSVLDYPVNQISNLLALGYSSNISINKKDLLEALERIEIFVNKQDEDIINLSIHNNMILQNLKSSAIEEINILHSNNISDFNCNINLQMFKSQIKSLKNDEVNIFYGDQKSIKLVENDVSLVIALSSI